MKPSTPEDPIQILSFQIRVPPMNYSMHMSKINWVYEESPINCFDEESPMGWRSSTTGAMVEYCEATAACYLWSARCCNTRNIRHLVFAWFNPRDIPILINSWVAEQKSVLLHNICQRHLWLKLDALLHFLKNIPGMNYISRAMPAGMSTPCLTKKLFHIFPVARIKMITTADIPPAWYTYISWIPRNQSDLIPALSPLCWRGGEGRHMLFAFKSSNIFQFYVLVLYDLLLARTSTCPRVQHSNHFKMDSCTLWLPTLMSLSMFGFVWGTTWESDTHPQRAMRRQHSSFELSNSPLLLV